MRRVLIGLWLFLGLAQPILAQDELQVCANIDDYQKRVGEGVNHMVSKSFDDALTKFEEAEDLCPDDPDATYGIASARREFGECVRAAKLFKKALDKYDAAVTHGISLSGVFSREKIETKLQQSLSCESRSYYKIICPQSGVKVTLDDATPEVCNDALEGVATPGQHSLELELEGHLSKTVPLALVEGRGQANALTLEELVEIKNDGVLILTCPENIKVVEISSTDVPSLIVPCPSEQILAPGAYVVTIPGEEEGQSVTLIKGERTQLPVQVQGVELTQAGLFIGLRGAPGSGYVGARALFDENNDKGVSVLKDEDAPQPTLTTGALINEIGYRINDNIAAGVQLRFGFPNFSFAGGAFFRYIPWFNDVFGLRLDASFGGGSILAGFSFSSGADPCASPTICLARFESVYAGLALGFDIRLSRVFSLVLMTEARLFFPDVAVHFDFASLGVEVNF